MRPLSLLLLCLLLFGCSAPPEPSRAPEVVPVQVETPPPPDPTVRLAFVGDILLGEGLAGIMAKRGDDYPWEHVAPILKQADLAIGNLETAVTTGGQPEPDKQFTFRSRPSTLAGAARAGIDILSLANNHSRDFGPEALLETIRHVEEAGMKPVGAGADLAQAIRPALVEVGGLKLAFLGFSRVIPETHWVAWEGNPGVAPGWDPKVVGQAVADARKEADAVILLIHWGEELKDQPRPADAELAEMLLRQGATLIIGHHPHVLQGIAFRDSKLVAYSLGNFIFPTTPRSINQETGILEVTLTRSGVTEARLTPFFMEGGSGKPRPAKAEESRRILERLDRLSRPWRTQVGSDGRISPPSGRPSPPRVQ